MSKVPTCSVCGRAEDHSLDDRQKFKVELRPYGKDGAAICFQCAMGNPKRKRTYKKNFLRLLDKAGQIAVIGDGPPRAATVPERRRLIRAVKS